MAITVNITDENGCVVLHKEHADMSKFYLGMIDEVGRYSSIGTARPTGKVVIKSIGEWAQEWAKEQDLIGFFQELREVLVAESIKVGNVQAQLYLQVDNFSFNADELRSILQDIKTDVAVSFKEKLGKEGGVIFFNVVWEMMLAMVIRLKEESSKVQTIWEYPSLPICRSDVEAVLEWIFKRKL